MNQMKNQKIETILVRSPNWIGDQVLAFPFFYALREQFPKAKITAVCVPWVEDLQYKHLVDEVRVIKPPIHSTLLNRFKNVEHFSKTLKKEKPFDLGISLPHSFSAAWLLYRSNVLRRRGVSVEGRGFLLNDPLQLPSEEFAIQHRAEAYLSLLPEKPKWSMHSFFSKPAENPLDDKIKGILEDFNEDLYWPMARIQPPREKYFIVAPGATADSRRWPLEYFIHLLRTIQKETGWATVVVGGPKEAPLAERLSEVDGINVLDYTARGSVPMLASLFRNAEFAITNESGLSHVSALFGTFTQIVCGAADPRRTRPIGPGSVQVSINSVSCWPCEKNTCSQVGDLKLSCLMGIKPEKVWEEIRAGLERLEKINPTPVDLSL